MPRWITSALVLSTCMSAAAAGPVDFERLAPRWDAAVADLDVPGVAVAVVARGGIVFEGGFGSRDLERSRPTGPDTMHYIASTTKSFTALAVLALIEDGLVELDAPVTRYLPRFRLAEGGEGITVRDLLSHAQGLTGELPISLHESYTGHAISDDFYYSRLGDYVTPGGSFRYGNLHFSLASRVIEAAAGEDWRSFLQRRVLTPAGLLRTTTSASEAQSDANVADMVYRAGPGQWRAPDIEKTDGSMSAAGGMYSTAHDLARWILLHQQDGIIDGQRIVREDLVRATRTPQVEVNDSFLGFQREHYGLGWYVGSYRGETLVHAFGSFVSGARSHVSYMPEHGVGVVALTNVAHGPGVALVDEIAKDVYDSFLDHDAPPGRYQDLRPMLDRAHPTELSGLPLPNRENNPAIAADGLTIAPDACAGRFVSDEFGEIEVVLADGELHIAYGAVRRAGLTTFRAPDTFIVFLQPHSIAAPGQFVIRAGRVEAVAIDLPGTPDGVAMFERR